MKITGKIHQIDTVKICDLSKLLGIGPRQIQRLAASGIIPKPDKRGCYDLQKCIERYTAHQRKQLQSVRAMKKKRAAWSFPKNNTSKAEAEARMTAALSEIEELFQRRLKRK